MANGFGPGLAKASQLSGAVTTITSLLKEDIVIGEDTQTKIDFETANEIHFDADNSERVKIDSTGLTVSGLVDVATELHFDSSPADGAVSGITATFTAGEALELGEVVYLKAADGKMYKAVSGVGGTGLITPEIMCKAIVAQSTISADATGKFLLKGFIHAATNFPTYAIGETLYVPEAEASGQNVPEGDVPDTDGDFVQVVGWAVTGDIIYFNPDYTIIEHA